MDLIDQKTKEIMEKCKESAREAGLSFHNETLEYVLTNKDLLDLTPKNMIPTLYDFWVHDVKILQERKIYELFPNNPYETVINTRPPISFYNDNNPEWLNVMIFYHVIAHIDFFQNNSMFKNTWNDDFCGLALADKRLIASLRSEKGRWVDYVIEFARGINNIIGFYDELNITHLPKYIKSSKKINFYFDAFLSSIKKVSTSEYVKEIERYNKCRKEYSGASESIFFPEVEKRFPEFEALFNKDAETKKETKTNKRDMLKYLCDKSLFLNTKENEWMKSIIEIVRRTSLYFEPQIRTKILNEGWASYWHEKLFLTDNRITGHEVDYARVNSKVLSLPKAGLNPYALGWRLLMHIEEMADKGRLTYDFEKIKDVELRKKYDRKTGEGRNFLFYVRENYNDFMFINNFVDQDFVNKYNLYVVGRRLNKTKGVWEYYVKSKDAEEYKKMLIDSLYHPPYITVDESKAEKKELYLNHNFEGKPLVPEYIENTMLGIEYLFGGAVHLETTEVDKQHFNANYDKIISEEVHPEYSRVQYTMKDRKLTKKVLHKVAA